MYISRLVFFFTDLHLQCLTADKSFMAACQQAFDNRDSKELLTLRDMTLEFAKLCEEKVTSKQGVV